MKRPFSHEYVLKETIRHMQDAIDISMKKTLVRLSEFKDEPESLKEALQAISNLNRLTSMLNSIKSNNKQLLG